MFLLSDLDDFVEANVVGLYRYIRII